VKKKRFPLESNFRWPLTEAASFQERLKKNILNPNSPISDL
jgi:hypothetical protein